MFFNIDFFQKLYDRFVRFNFIIFFFFYFLTSRKICLKIQTIDSIMPCVKDLWLSLIFLRSLFISKTISSSSVNIAVITVVACLIYIIYKIFSSLFNVTNNISVQCTVRKPAVLLCYHTKISCIVSTRKCKHCHWKNLVKNEHATILMTWVLCITNDIVNSHIESLCI